ncbi:putative Golgin subfamily A member 7 [Hypsibius exemplaris]|uniref:Ras modification protein ERF4 n=1 Tax=Hypsibius exemplaris TaxID=2072580 RepID=A0A1W0XFD7_HYPEX|nr:putative Golgin subfamily A member 7 [Hypsibius exemplaris]
MEGSHSSMAQNNANGKGTSYAYAPVSTSSRYAVFIERDYTQGIQVRFQEKFPAELDGKMDPATFQSIIQRLNEIYDDAESPNCATAWENCVGCCTCYLAFIFMESRYNKCLKKARSYIAEQNRQLTSRGITIIDPYERGMRLVEIRFR